MLGDSDWVAVRVNCVGWVSVGVDWGRFDVEWGCGRGHLARLV